MVQSTPVAGLDALRREFRGDLLRPGDDGYEAARQVWNAMVDKRPQLIARCSGAADVAAAVRFAREQGLEIAVRGGGHSVVGLSVTDGGLMIDLSRMRGVRVDPEARRVWVQGGCLLGDMDHETTHFGLATTGGVISHTGVAGLTLGGGMGYLARLAGLSCDNLVSAEVVTADGSSVVASQEADADLHWALRGGGGNFGVVTGFEFTLHPIPRTVVTGDAIYDLDTAMPALEAMRELAAEAPESVTWLAGVFTAEAWDWLDASLHGKPLVDVSFVDVGFHPDVEPLMARLRAAAKPAVEMVDTMTYTALQAISDASQAHGRRRYWKGHHVPELSDAALQAFLERGGSRDLPLCNGALQQLGGAISRVGATDTAFGTRDATWDFITAASWDDPAEDDQRLADARAYGERMQPFGRGVYVNTLTDEGADRVRSAYGRNFERLQQVKARYDPENVFHLNQNIPPATAA